MEGQLNLLNKEVDDGWPRIVPKANTRCWEVYQRLLWQSIRLDEENTWVAGTELATVHCGGSEGLRRVRELRGRFGWPIIREKDPAGKGRWRYRMAKLGEFILDE